LVAQREDRVVRSPEHRDVPVRRAAHDARAEARNVGQGADPYPAAQLNLSAVMVDAIG